MSYMTSMTSYFLYTGCINLTSYKIQHVIISTYRKSPDRSRVPDKRRVPDTGRGSRQIVLIEAGGFYPGIYGISMIGIKLHNR